MKNLLKRWNETSLVLRIILGLAIGIVLGLAAPQAAPIALLGDLFVGALKAVAPLLVLFLVMTAISRHQEGQRTNMSRVIVLYLLGTFIDGCVAVITSFLFPVTLELAVAEEQTAAPGGIGDVLHTLLMNLVSNPIDALLNANYIGILAWAVLLGIALRKAAPGTKHALENIADAISQTDGMVILYQGQPIQAVFFSSAAGRTVDAVEVWGNAVPYLTGVDSPEGEEDVPNYHSTVTIPAEEFKSRLLAWYCFRLSLSLLHEDRMRLSIKIKRACFSTFDFHYICKDGNILT